MSSRVFGACVPALAALLALAAPAAAAEAVGKNDVRVTLKITDKKSGLTLEAKKAVASGSNAFDVLRRTVAVTYRTDPELGPMVTGLCGVSAPKGTFWAVYVDGKLSKVGVGRLTIVKDTVIEWKTQQIDDE